VKIIRSFDVFDTCLTRRVGVPSDLFYDVARKTLSRLGQAASRPLLEDFVTARMEAERMARQQTSTEEVNLADIWKILMRSMGCPHDPALVRCELEAEAESLVPIAAMREQVRTARQQGDRIVFLSDMYLPTDFIERQLKTHGFAESGDGFYVSADIGKTKASGNLFRHVLEQESTPAANVWHTGDNPHSDYLVPRRLGIRAHLFQGCEFSVAELNLLPAGSEPHTASRIAGGMRAFRLEREGGDDNINELVSQFVGPFALGFASWVLRRAQEDGVKRLYFAARDCQLIWRVAQELSPRFGGLECRYLEVSRQALFLPSAAGLAPQEMPWMDRFWEQPELDRLLAKLELTFPEVAGSLAALAGTKQGAYRLSTPQDWAFFWNALNAAPTRQLVMERIAIRREAARSYFESAGLLDPIPWALVDLGWFLTCQRSLWTLLKMWGRPEPVRGFYLGLSNRRIGLAEAGIAEALIYEPAPDLPPQPAAPTIFSHAILLEHVVGCADHPPVHHYELDPDRKARAAGSGMVDPKSMAFSRTLQEAVLSFVRRHRSLADDFRGTTNCQAILESLMAGFVTSPTRRMAASLCDVSAGLDQNNLDTLPLVKPLTLGTALLPLLPRRGPLEQLWKKRDCYWQQAGLAMTPDSTRRVAKVVQWLAHQRGRVRQTLLPP
jgi:FMN phosphatase YigB (HAD superfamily)